MVALPLVLPPTVLGFYLLVAMGPQRAGRAAHPGARAWARCRSPFRVWWWPRCIYSLPFVVQPLQNAFEAMGERPLEAAATLRASPLDAFFSVAVPLARPGFLTAAMLSFAHTVGEFGVVLMIGGNIPGKTRVLSVQIYDHVEALEYAQAHWLAGGMLVFSFVVLLALYTLSTERGAQAVRTHASIDARFSLRLSRLRAGRRLDAARPRRHRAVRPVRLAARPRCCAAWPAWSGAGGLARRQRRGLAGRRTRLPAHPPARRWAMCSRKPACSRT